jgi:type IV pilus assembly protein PilA
MRKNNRKGFTIVELVIVIAVIAILAGVLIPTFASIISKANESKALQEAQNAYKEAYALAVADGKIDSNEAHKAGNYEFTFNGTLENPNCTVKVKPGSDAAKDDYAVSVTAAGKVSVAKIGDGVNENTTY